MWQHSTLWVLLKAKRPHPHRVKPLRCICFARPLQHKQIQNLPNVQSSYQLSYFVRLTVCGMKRIKWLFFKKKKKLLNFKNSIHLKEDDWKVPAASNYHFKAAEEQIRTDDILQCPALISETMVWNLLKILKYLPTCIWNCTFLKFGNKVNVIRLKAMFVLMCGNEVRVNSGEETFHLIFSLINSLSFPQKMQKGRIKSGSMCCVLGRVTYLQLSWKTLCAYD